MAEFPASPSTRTPPPAAPTPAHGPHPTGFAPDSEVHLLDRFAVLYRYRRIVVTVFVLTSAVMMIQGYTNIQMFQARGQLLIEDERSTAVPGIAASEQQYYEDPEPYYNTQYRILKGRDLTRRVVKRLHLENVPEFNGTAQPPKTPLSFVHDLQTSAMQWIKPAAAQPAEAPKVDETADESALVSAFIGRVSVEPIKSSRLVDVSFTSTDANFAALAINTLLDEYVESNLAIKLESSQNMLDWLGKELEKQERKVQESEQALATYREKQNAMSLDDKQNIVTQRLTSLNEALIKSRTEKIQKESLYNQVKSMSGTTSLDAMAAIASSPQLQTLKTRMAELIREKGRLEERYGPKHAQVQANAAQIQDTQRQIDFETTKAIQTVKNDYETAVLQERTLAANVEAAKADAQDLSRKSVGYNVMEREAKSNRQVYESLLQRDKELRVSSNSRQNNVRIVDRAEVPKAPLAPTGRRTWMVSMFVGLVLALGVAFGLDYMNDTIKTPEDVNRRLKLPFLGLVPSVRGEKHPLLTSSHVPHDFGESFRALRTSLISKYPEPGTKLVLVTSAQPLEGKTTTAANIAMALAYGGVPRAADRRRHAASGSASSAAPHQRPRALTGARGPGAGARCDSAHGRSEPARDHRRQDAAEPVRAARVRAHADAADATCRTGPSTGSSSTRRRCSR